MSMGDIFPTFNLGSSGANAIASSVNDYGLSLGLPPTISGALGATAGNEASGLMGSLPSTSASLGTASPASPSNDGGGAASFWDQTKCWLNAWSVGDVQKCSTGTQTAANAVNSSPWANLTFSGIVTVLAGVALLAGGLYLLGSSQLTAAISSTVKGS